MPQPHRRTRPLPAFLLLAAVLSCRNDPPVAVGAALSTQFVNATRMALAEAAERGGLPAIDTVLLHEHSNRAAPALEIAETLLANADLIGMVGHSNSSSSLATAPLYNSREVVQIAPTSTAESYTRAGRFSFRLVPPDTEQGGFLAGVVDSIYPDGTRLAVMYVNDDYGRGLRTAFLASIDTNRFPVVFQQAHTDEEFVTPPPDREQRVRATIASVLDSRPEVLLWLGRATTFHLYLRVLREHDRELPVFGGDALASWSTRNTGVGEWDGVRYADFLDLEGSEPLRNFRRRFQERYGAEARTPEVLSYDAMQLLLAAVRDGARTGEEVREWLASLGGERPAFQGITGPIAFNADGDIARSYVLVTVPPAAPAGIP